MWRLSRKTFGSLSARKRSFDMNISAAASLRRRVSSTSERPIIISRRAWEAYKKKNTPPVPAAPKKAKEESKPWPRNFQIAGYVAAILGIPYSLLWFVSSNKGIRDKLAELNPSLNDRLRSHFGSPEFDEYSYVDIKDEKMTPHQILADEWPYEVRCLEEEIDRLNREDVPVRISLIQGDGGDEKQPLITLSPRTIPGDTAATQSTILEMAKAARDYMVDTFNTQEKVQVAVDFQDVSSPDEKCNESDLAVSEMSHQKDSVPKPTFQQQLYSSWFYQPDRTTSATQRMSDQEVHISRLEYDIERLQADLKDVNCTRNVDDMQRELKEAKGELRKIVWKRRLRV